MPPLHTAPDTGGAQWEIVNSLLLRLVKILFRVRIHVLYVGYRPTRFRRLQISG